MHIPASMLHGQICPVTATISVLGLSSAVYCGIKSKDKPTAANFGAVSALIFAGQMMNFPITNGTSGHLIGGVLAASLLGTPFAVVAIALVVAIQSLLFSDGGVAVLGANILNMAIIGTGIGGLIRSKLISHQNSTRGKILATAFAAWASVIVASFAVSVELAINGQIGFLTVLTAMVGTHALIGIGESLITVACFLLIHAHGLTKSDNKATFGLPLTAAALVALVLSPFASSMPDGLESIAQKYNLLHQSAPDFVGIFSGYSFPLVNNHILSTGFAGLAGVMVAFGVGWLISRILRPFTV